jgi:hemoglobin/transferrin/lactoferrin receptor protein
MRYIICILVCVCASASLLAQQPAEDTSNRFVTTLNEVVVSGTKFGEKRKNIAQKIDVISGKYISKVNAQNTGDLLISTGNVFVQKSQQGGSSPVIRGFEASRVLIVVDGVRMNNLIFRSGHLQNVITVDQNMLESVEVMYGPASTLYGSDALGGVIHLRTKNPKLANGKNLNVGGNAFVRYSSANKEKTSHIDINLGGKKIAWLQSYNYSDFGDMQMGKNYLDKYPTFGRRDSMISYINGIDSVVKNSDNSIQRFSGYKQWDILQKLLFKQSDKISHTLNLQFSNTNNVPRYDRLQDKRNNTLRFAEWYYGPQKRNLFAYEFNAANLHGIVDEIRANISYQNIEESRQTREYRRYDRLDSRVEKVKVASYVVDARKKWGMHELTFGTDGQLNSLQSTATRTNIRTGAVSKLDTRYPDGDNTMNNFSLYAQHTYKMMEGKLVLNEGIRFQTSRLKSTLVDTALLFKLPFTSINQQLNSVTGNIGLVYLPTNATKLSLVISSGFRAPNIDDLAKIFESSTSARQLVVPNADIKPEKTYNIDLGISHVFSKKVKIEVNGFYTWFRDALVKAPYRLNGQDSVVYAGVKSQVLANQNKNKAYLFGFSASVSADITDHLSASTTINYTKGEFETNPGLTSAVYKKQPTGSYALVQANVSSKPLDHIPPVFGKTSVQYTHKSFQAELFALYNGWKRLDDFNADGEDNAQYATADGMPAWFTLNLRSSYSFKKYITIQAAVENIFDRNYRYFASGFSAPGRNFIIAVRASF